MQRAGVDELDALLADLSWPARSLPATDLTPAFRFRLAPLAAGAPDWMPTPAEIAGNEIEAARRMTRHVRVEGGPIIPGQLLFPVQLRFQSSRADQEVGFPWWDTFHEMTDLFDWLRESEDGDDWSDVDQGWLFKAARRGEQLHFLHHGFDQGEELANLSVERTAFLLRLDTAEGEARRTLARLELEALRSFGAWKARAIRRSAMGRERTSGSGRAADRPGKPEVDE
jgi:hypothetical protein